MGGGRPEPFFQVLFKAVHKTEAVLHEKKMCNKVSGELDMRQSALGSFSFFLSSFLHAVNKRRGRGTKTTRIQKILVMLRFGSITSVGETQISMGTTIPPQDLLFL